MALSLIPDPKLVEFLIVLNKMPADEKEQYEALLGPFDPERAAAVSFLKPGPKWVIYGDGQPIALAGFDDMGAGNFQDWMFSTPEAWERHGKAFTRLSRRVMDGMLENGARRLQCISLASRIQAHRWYGALGLRLDGPLRGIGRNGEDALVFSRMRASDG